MPNLIDYRAWDKSERVMYYHVQDLYDWSYVTDKDKNHSAWESGGCIGGECFGKLLQNKNLIMMQYTGYDDITGKRIYESDICKYFIDGVWKKGVVGWAQGGFTFVVIKINEKYTKHTFYFQIFEPVPISNNVMLNEFQVIGNIYENIAVI